MFRVLKSLQKSVHDHDPKITAKENGRNSHCSLRILDVFFSTLGAGYLFASQINVFRHYSLICDFQNNTGTAYDISIWASHQILIDTLCNTQKSRVRTLIRTNGTSK